MKTYNIKRFSFFESSSSSSFSSETINGKPVHASMSGEHLENNNGHVRGRRISKHLKPKKFAIPGVEQTGGKIKSLMIPGGNGAKAFEEKFGKPMPKTPFGIFG